MLIPCSSLVLFVLVQVKARRGSMEGDMDEQRRRRYSEPTEGVCVCVAGHNVGPDMCVSQRMLLVWSVHASASCCRSPTAALVAWAVHGIRTL
jgi:hypothetical protein